MATQTLEKPPLTAIPSVDAFIAANPAPVITSESLGNVQPYNIPPANTKPTTGNLGMANNSATGTIKADASYTPPVNAEKEKANKGLSALISKISGQAEEATQINQDEGILEKKQKATAISTELDVLDKSFRDEVAAIRENPEGKFGGAVEQDVAKAQDRYENRRANISLAYKVAYGDYQGAQEIANEKINALKDQNAQSLQAYQLLTNAINNDLTESEKLIVQANIDQKKQKAKTVEDAYAAALQAGNDNKAGAGYYNALDRARETGNVADILSTVSQYGYRTLDQQQAEAGLANTYSQIADRKAEAARKLTDLDPKIQVRVQTIANQFDNEQAVKNYQTSAEAIDALNTAGTSPTDDIGRVYAFAKVMDPNSVVREGEYKTVQDYSTALLERTGIKAKRIFDNAGFLTQEARNFMKTTLDNRLSSSKKAYDNIYTEYGRRINKITGETDGTDYMTDYSRAFQNSDATPKSEEQQLLDAGYTQEQIDELKNK